MYILNIARAMKSAMSVNEIRELIFENYYKSGFSKENRYYSMKHLKKRFVVACKQIYRKNT